MTARWLFADTWTLTLRALSHWARQPLVALVHAQREPALGELGRRPDEGDRGRVERAGDAADVDAADDPA